MDHRRASAYKKGWVLVLPSTRVPSTCRRDPSSLVPHNKVVAGPHGHMPRDASFAMAATLVARTRLPKPGFKRSSLHRLHAGGNPESALYKRLIV